MRYLFLSAALAALAALASLAAACGGEAPPEKKAPRLSGPYRHKNLTVFLVHGADRIKGKNILTLKEAIEQKKVTVHETGDVQKLAIENTSKDVLVFVHSGDIVKGGKQDRVIAYDFIVPPKSGRMSISSFCVERGRWSKRGAERLDKFSGSGKIVASKRLKLAAKYEADQGRVWAQVAKSQGKLARSVGAPVADPRSASSMQLTLENKKVQKSIKEYRDALAGIVAGKKGVIGFAFAINGKVNSADVYASGDLFRKLWPKLLESSATEAVTELKKGAKHKAVTAGDIQACMADAAKGKAREKKISPRATMKIQETKDNYLFETRAKIGGEKAEVIHENYLTK